MGGLPWSDEANIQLMALCRQYKDDEGKVDYEKVAAEFPARTPRACTDQHWKLQRTITSEKLLLSGDYPSYQQLFEAMKDNPMTLISLSNLFDRSPKVLRQKIMSMEEEGYNLVIMKRDRFAIRTSTKPEAKPPDISIADLMGKEFNIGVVSDIHAGSSHAQPTSLNQFIKYAYEEYDIRHMFVAGDVMDGAYVYRGHINELIPQARPLKRSMMHRSTRVQVGLADIYLPKMEDLTYYVLGGNHDYNHMVVAGLDAIRMLCKERDDMVYGGYDLWGIPLTEKAYVRLWHATGGVAYARSYKLQKGIESLAFEALREAMRENVPPIVSLLIAGHWHLTNHTPEPPLHGILAGCFQSQTSYLKRKKLAPHIAGIILQMKVDNFGRIHELAHRVVDFDEIKDDWENWPVPEQVDPDVTPDVVDVLFGFEGEPPQDEEVSEAE